MGSIRYRWDRKFKIRPCLLKNLVADKIELLCWLTVAWLREEDT
jgi:hypothetical protein